MQCSQFLANAMQAHHPSHAVVCHPPGARLGIKPTLQHCFGHRVSQFVRDGVISPPNYKKALKTLHTETVAAVRDGRSPNHVLDMPPPEIHPSKATLSRIHRTTLSQLRSGWCKDLRTYQKLIRKTHDGICPECLISPHSFSHTLGSNRPLGATSQSGLFPLFPP